MIIVHIIVSFESSQELPTILLPPASEYTNKDRLVEPKTFLNDAFKLMNLQLQVNVILIKLLPEL